MSKLVSILIPAFNAQRWIRHAIESALTQSWQVKEVIVVDDGSTDDTLAEARHYASTSVKVVTQENRGASAARNHALSLAQGEYIQWLDADDVLAPDKIARQMEAARSRGDLTVFSGAFGVFHYRIGKAKFTPTCLWRDHTPMDWALTRFTNRAWMIPASWLVSRRLAEMAGPWDERLSLNDDAEYFCRVVLASGHVCFVESAKCYYRSTGYSQLSRTRSDRALESLLLSLRLCAEHLRAVEDSERTRAASLALLGMYTAFWRDTPGVRAQADWLAEQLGGRLQEDSTDRRMSMLSRAVGTERASRWIDALRRMRLEAEVRWDDALHRLES